MNPDIQIGKRTTYNLLNWLEDVGGFYGAIKVFFDILIFFIRSNTDFKDIFIINRLFKLHNSDFKEQRLR